MRSNDSDIFRWVRRFLDWLGRAGRPRQREAVVLEEFVTDRAVLSRLECDKPGVVELWRITHKHARRNLLITLLYLPQLREDLGRSRRSSSSAPSFDSWRRSLAYGHPDAIAAVDAVDATHGVVVVWASRHPIRQIVGGKTRFVHRTEVAAVIWCDLEGHTRAWSPSNRYARQTVRSLLRWLVNLSPPYPAETWEDTVRLIDWKHRLAQWAQAHLGKNHALQPPKRPEIRF